MTEYKATPHRAKPEVWTAVERWSKNDMESFNCILELRSRVEALESAQRPTVKDSLTVPADSLTAPVTRDRAEDAPESSDSLVEQVADAICISAAEARAAILAVAYWSEQQGLRTAADWLRQEVG